MVKVNLDNTLKVIIESVNPKYLLLPLQTASNKVFFLIEHFAQHHKQDKLGLQTQTIILDMSKVTILQSFHKELLVFFPLIQTSIDLRSLKILHKLLMDDKRFYSKQPSYIQPLSL